MDKLSGRNFGYGFVEFRTEDDAEYALRIMNMIRIFGKPLRINKGGISNNSSGGGDRGDGGGKPMDVGANLFIGNLAPEVDEKLLHDTFSAFGGIIEPPKIMRDIETGTSKGFGFVDYDNFEASDRAIDTMNGQYLGGRPITIQYAYKKGTVGERHGSQAERLLAAASRTKETLRPHTLFATGPGQIQSSIPHLPPMNPPVMMMNTFGNTNISPNLPMMMNPTPGYNNSVPPAYYPSSSSQMSYPPPPRPPPMPLSHPMMIPPPLPMNMMMAPPLPPRGFQPPPLYPHHPNPGPFPGGGYGQQYMQHPPPRPHPPRSSY